MVDRAVDERVLRVLLVDDHAAARGGLRMRLSREPDLAIVGEAAAAAEALAVAADLALDVALVDLALADGDGIELIGRLRELAPTVRAVVLTLYDTPEHRLRARRTGASFVGKQEAIDVLLAAIRGQGTS